MRFGWSWGDQLRAAYIVLAILFAALAPARAQQPEAVAKSPPALTGSVVGYVSYDETRLPARFAEIHLVPKPADAVLARAEDKTNPSEMPEPHLRMVSGISAMDGSFHIDGVPVGDYLAGALMAGYVASGTSMPADDATDDQLKSMIASMPTVHVGEGQIVNVNLALHRGAMMTGRVQFADGSPAIGVKVQWELADRDLGVASVRMARSSPLREIVREFDYYAQHDLSVTADDEGRYRIFGLAPGKYIVSTTIASQLGSGQVLMTDGNGFRASGRNRSYPDLTTVYAPGVFRRKGSKVFEIRGDEQVTDADLRIDPSGLHTVRGKVLAGEDHHVPSTTILRVLEDGRDTGRLVETEDDGTFQINYLPSGSYTLEVIGSPDTTVPTGVADPARVLRHYQMGKLAVVVDEHDVVLDDLLLTALKPGEKMDAPQ
jgi:hypothetical protein